MYLSCSKFHFKKITFFTTWQNVFELLHCNADSNLNFRVFQNLMIMISSSAFEIFVSFLVLGLCWNQLNASRQVKLTCGPDEAIQKGSPGFPGKRGLKGSNGARGRKGRFM